MRISSSGEGRFRYVAGLFYQEQTHDIEQVYLIDGLATSLEVTDWPDTWWLTQQVRNDKDYAIFGELTYDLTDKLSLTGGSGGCSGACRFFKVVLSPDYNAAHRDHFPFDMARYSRLCR